MKTGEEKKTEAKIFFAIGLLFLLVVLTPLRAEAQLCETAVSANPGYRNLANKMVNDWNDFIAQTFNFIDAKLSESSYDEVLNRLEEIDMNFRAGMSQLWRNYWIGAMRNMTEQLSVAQVDQTRVIGSFIDAMSVNEAIMSIQSRNVENVRRFRPNESSCQVDSVGHGQTKMYRASRALAKGFAYDDQRRRGNEVGQPGAQGWAAEQKSMWQEYTTFFCDPAKGDQGCTTPGLLAGQHNDLPALLWGDRQTIDMSVSTNQQLVAANTKYLLSPKTPDPIKADLVTKTQGQEAILARRARDARMNAVYNVIGQMIGERAGGSGVNTQNMRIASGLPAGDASTDASYREIMEAMTRNRFNEPEYVVRMLGDPEQLIREQGSVNALRMQQMNDLYKRLEEMVVMEAAVYAHELDKRRPGTAMSSTNLR